jgi:hypothetical protein
MSSTLEAVHIFSAIVIKKQIAFAEGIWRRLQSSCNRIKL